LIEEVLRGQKPGDIPVVVVTNGDLIINRETATQYGINVDLLQREGAKVISGAN
jgi:ABC-type uncharacterized transport system substrate-binding protein